MAAEVKRELGIDTELIKGNSGEFTIWLDGQKIVEKTGQQFPSPEAVIAAIRKLSPAGTS